jgi:hypothetical protein
MKTTKTLLAAVALSVGLLSAATANATLTVVDGGQLVADSVANITWLANANMNGQMTWDQAQSWIKSLNTTDYLGYNHWMLPSADPSCGFNFNCTGSQMGELFYTEGGLSAGESIFASTTLTSDFTNLQSYYYWSGTEYAPYTTYAWLFGTNGGYQFADDKNLNLFAMAVLPGQVGAVPEPETYAMLLAGLGLIGFTTLQRKHKFTA